MSSVIDAIGDVVSGSMLGRTVEPVAGEGTASHGNCLNCGNALVGKHCHGCGQAGHVHRTLAAFGHDFLHGVFHFEGKVWRTLPMLIWKPGELTRRYVNGERARFVSPLAMFLFMMFAMFAVFSATAGHLDALADFKPKQIKDARAALDQRLVKAKDNLRTMQTKAAALPADSEDKADVLEGINDAQSDIAEINSGLQGIASLPGNQLEYDDKGVVFKGVKSNIPVIDEGIAKAQKNPALFLYKLQNAAYKFSWALIPISIPFVWLMFAWRRQFKVYDHAVFVTYSLCFMALVAMIAVALGRTPIEDRWIIGLVMLVPPIHMFRQLQGGYSLGFGNALVRTSYLVIASLTAFTLFTALLIVLGVIA